MFGFLFKKSKGLDKESKARQSTKDFLARRNSTTSATTLISTGIGNERSGGGASTTVTLTCSNSSPEITSVLQQEQFAEHETNEVQPDLEVVGDACTTSEDDPPLQMSIPVVLVSNSGPVTADEEDWKVEECSKNLLRRDSEEDRSFCCSSPASSTNSDSVIGNHTKGQNAGSSSSMTNLLSSSSSGEEICGNGSTSGLGTSEDALLKSFMSDTEIEFIDETLDDGCSISISGPNHVDDDDTGAASDCAHEPCVMSDEAKTILEEEQYVSEREKIYSVWILHFLV